MTLLKLARWTGLLVVCAVVHGCTPASAVDFSCPSELQTNQTARGDLAEWQPADLGAVSQLDGVMLLSGRPIDNASLVPDDSIKDGKVESDIWSLQPGAKEGFWVGCTYLNTRLVLTKRVPETAKQCTAKYALTENGNRLKLLSVSCSSS